MSKETDIYELLAGILAGRLAPETLVEIADALSEHEATAGFVGASLGDFCGALADELRTEATRIVEAGGAQQPPVFHCTSERPYSAAALLAFCDENGITEGVAQVAVRHPLEDAGPGLRRCPNCGAEKREAATASGGGD